MTELTDPRAADAMLVEVRGRLAAWLEDEARQARFPGEDDQEAYCEAMLEEALAADASRRLAAGGTALGRWDEEAIRVHVRDGVFGAGVMQPFLGGEWSDVLVSSELLVLIGATTGLKEYRPSPFASDEEAVAWVRWQAQRHGRAHRFDTAHPKINLRLPDGTRLHAVMGFTRRCHIALRPHPRSLDRLDALREAGLTDRALHAFSVAAVAARVNVLVVGATGAGKTTFVRALLNEALATTSDRIVTIEEDEELFLTAGPTRDVVAMTAREPNVHGAGAITLDDCLREALRQRPDRIILGEARPGGTEVLGILLAMSSGHPGSFSTIHADTSGEAFQRLALYAAMGGQTYTPEWVAQLISTAVDFVVHLGRTGDGRRVVTSVREVTGALDRAVLSSEVWAPDPQGRAVPHGPFTDRMVGRLEDAGFDLALRDKPDGWWDR